MSRTGENIYKRKDGRWEGRYIKNYDCNKKAHYGYVYAHSYLDVKQKLQMAASDTLRGIIICRCSPVFIDISKQWESFHSTSWKISTRNKYKAILNKHLIPFFGPIQVHLISTSLLQEFFYVELLQKKGLSQKSCKDIKSVLKQIFFYAENLGHHLTCNISSVNLKQEIKTSKYLNNDEFERLRWYLIKDSNKLKIGVLVCMLTGIRIGELCALRWQDIEFKEAIIHISTTIQRVQSEGKTKVIITTPKSSCSIRDIPITSGLLEILKPIRSEDNDYLLSGNTKPVEPRLLQYHFKKYLLEAGIRPVNFHALRHTFATHCISLGFDIKALSEILGHSSVKITLDRYVHTSMCKKIENMKLLDKAFSPSKPPSDYTES